MTPRKPHYDLSNWHHRRLPCIGWKKLTIAFCATALCITADRPAEAFVSQLGFPRRSLWFTTSSNCNKSTTTSRCFEVNESSSSIVGTAEEFPFPRHIAFVCDGNSRWAHRRNLPSSIGHAAGANRILQVLRTVQQHKSISHCTFFGFSTENWKRSDKEIREIWNAMEQTVFRSYDKILQENIRIKIIGDLSDARIPESVREVFGRIENDTHALHEGKDDIITICLAINYGGRQDILKASKVLALRIAGGSADAENITEQDFASCLDTSGIPDPDLLIRTSGEKRLSNFLLWNAAYTEIYFTDTFWPDFDASSVQSALDWYATRKRRFGARKCKIA